MWRTLLTCSALPVTVASALMNSHGAWRSGIERNDQIGLSPRTVGGEFVGCVMLMIVVVGSGLAAQSLSPGDLGLELLENASAIGAGLFAIINIVGPVSGAHLNPIVSLVDAWFGACSWVRALVYIPVQIVGCIIGTVVANVMFDRAWISWSTHHRASWPALPVRDRRDDRFDPPGLRAQAKWPTEHERCRRGPLHLHGLFRDVLGDVREPGRDHRPIIHQ